MIKSYSLLVTSLIASALAQDQGQDLSGLTETPSEEVINIGGIYDLNVYDWAPDIFEVTVDRINREWRQANPRHPRLIVSLDNSKCDETTAARAYWHLKEENGGKPPDGIVGPRCSGPCASLARISGLEQVPQISPSANSDRLSNDEEFPFLSRMVAPNDKRGEGRFYGGEKIPIKTRLTPLRMLYHFSWSHHCHGKSIWMVKDHNFEHKHHLC